MLNGFQKLFSRAVEQPSEEVEYAQYAQEVEETLRHLERHLHDSDDSDEIIQNVMRTACDFYQGDWVGFLEVDLELGLWTPYVWYNPRSNSHETELLEEFESAEFLPRWIQAIKENDAIIVTDAEEIKTTYPSEYDVYQRLRVEKILAVPVKPRPTGFLAIRNPQRYMTRSSMLQLLAYVLLSSINERKLLQSMKMSFSPDSIKRDSDVVINLFGNLEIYTSKGVLRESDLKSPKICRLLVYMLINKKTTVSPRELVEAIWPEEIDTENPGKNIRALIFRLRQSFGLISEYQLVETTPNGYRFNPDLHIMTDLQMFEKNWSTVQKTIAISSKVELLKQTVDLYKGEVLLSAAGEHWLIPTVSYFNLRYESVVNELLRVLSEQGDYHNLHKYAVQVLNIEPANKTAHYWLIYSMCQTGGEEFAKTQVEVARSTLNSEDFYELVESLKKISVEANKTTIRNGKWHI